MLEVMLLLVEQLLHILISLYFQDKLNSHGAHKLNLELLLHRVVFYTMLAVMLINNTVQILRFREALAVLT